MLPQGSVPAAVDPPEIVDQPVVQHNVARLARRYSTRARILWFAFWVGGLWAVFLSLAINVLLQMSNHQERGPFGAAENRYFFSAFVLTTASLAPFLFLLAGIAAATEVISRRSLRASQQNTEALVEAIEHLSRNSNPRGQEHSRPERKSGPIDPFLKNLNLEIDPREP